MRPYATEEAFLAEERDTLSRTAVTLIGAPSRPRGVIIRFEMTLNDGSPILRGEGRVLGFQAADERGPSALTLRFTRLDARSKALVDRATELRESSEPTASTSAAPRAPDTEPPAEDPLASTSMGMTMPSRADGPPSSGDSIALAISSGSLPLGEAEDIGIPASSQPDPAQRNGLLDRLRTRAQTLTPTQVASILNAQRSST
jgi:molecular chaperone DnaK